MFILLQFFCTKYFVLATDTITTIAGNSTSGSYSGDNGLAINAGLNYPAGVTVDSSGFYYLHFLNLLVINFSLYPAQGMYILPMKVIIVSAK